MTTIQNIGAYICHSIKKILRIITVCLFGGNVMKKNIVRAGATLCATALFTASSLAANVYALPIDHEYYIETLRAIEAGEREERYFPVYVRIDGGEPTEHIVPEGRSIAWLANNLRNLSGQNYIFEEIWSTALSENMQINLRTLTIAHHEESVPLSFEEEFVYTSELTRGTQKIETYGINGERRIIHFVQYIGGEEDFRTIVRDEIISEPRTQVVRIGTATPTHISASGEVFAYSRSLVMEATAYTNDFYSTGRHPGDPWFGITASGMQAQVGVVAVDTNVIPFHTRLYIEGYGFAIAGDRGAAIRGNKIDLFFDTRAEALEFGRQNLRVWILE